jgi:ferritin-like protein
MAYGFRRSGTPVSRCCASRIPDTLTDIRERVRVLLKATEQEALYERLWIMESGRVRQYDPDA